MSEFTGAGLILYYFDHDQLKYCILEDRKGRFDFPKGAIDNNEYPYDCAIREADEEANVKQDYFEPVLGLDPYNNFVCGDRLVLYLCKFNKENINNLRIKRNPKNGVLEHRKIMWLTKEEGNRKILSYMSGSLDWAESSVLNL